MLRRIFYGAPNNIESKHDHQSIKESSVWDSPNGDALVVQLESYENRLKETINAVSRHCQAIEEMWLRNCYQVQEQGSEQIDGDGSEDVLASVPQFRIKVITTLQAILDEITPLKLRCEHLKCAFNVMNRYEQKVKEIESTSRSDSSRLQRNRAKLQAASSRFKDLDNAIQSYIHAIVAKDIADVIGDTLENQLLLAQIGIAKRMKTDALNLQADLLQHRLTSTVKRKDEVNDCEDKSPPKRTDGDSNLSFEPAEDEECDVESNDKLSVRHNAVSPRGSVVDLSSKSKIKIMPKHLLNESHSVCPRKKHSHGTRTWHLHRRIKDSLADGFDLADCIRLPDGYQLQEWITVHAVDFFNELSLLFGTISEFCTVDSCPQMSAGPCYTYLWADGVQQLVPISLPAAEYVARLLTWVETQLDDPSLVSSTVSNSISSSSSKDPWLSTARVIFKRLFRVYAHIYHHHLDNFVVLQVESHLNFCFKRFILFVHEFQLVEQKELNALRKLIHALT